jgi:PAS domain S-box-containing protein
MAIDRDHAGEPRVPRLSIDALAGFDPEDSIQLGRCQIDLNARRVVSDGRPVALTTLEYDLLTYLALRPGRVFSREQLLNAVWSSGSAWQQPATVTEHIHRLRTKVELDATSPTVLITVRGAGYRLDRPSSEQERQLEPGPRRTDALAGQALLRRLIDGVLADVTDAVIITDRHLLIQSWNPAAEGIYGWSEDAVLGRHVLSVLQRAGGDDQLLDAWHGLQRVERWSGASVHATKTGTAVQTTGSTTVLRDDDGEPLGVVSVSRLAG